MFSRLLGAEELGLHLTTTIRASRWGSGLSVASPAGSVAPKQTPQAESRLRKLLMGKLG